MRIGVSVYCDVCQQRKCPRGRSAPVGLYMCDSECQGYSKEPLPGDLWAGETEEEFGYSVSVNATTEEK